jgi:DNA-binding phage protein
MNSFGVEFATMKRLTPTVRTIRDELRRRDISHQQFAVDSGVAYTTLYRIFQGTQIPSIKTTETMVEKLGFKLVVGQ